MDFWHEVWLEIGITPAHAVGVAIASLVLYFTCAAILRAWGQRLYANRSGTGLAVILVLGAVTGRSMLGPAPTMMGGVICLGVLVTLEWIFGVGRRFVLVSHRRPVVVWAQGRVIDAMLHRYHLSRQVIESTMRKAGVRNLDEVDAVILEPDGSLTVLRHGEEVDARLVDRLWGIELLTCRPTSPETTGQGG